MAGLKLETEVNKWLGLIRLASNRTDEEIISECVSSNNWLSFPPKVEAFDILKICLEVKSISEIKKIEKGEESWDDDDFD